MARIRHAGLAALVAGAALTGLAAKPASAATACGAVITNLSWVTWTSVWGVTITGAQYTQTSSTAFVNVVGMSFTARKDWFNVTTGTKANPLPGQEIRFTITITNIGTDTITTVHVTDTLPAGLLYKAGSLTVAPSAAGWTTSAIAGVIRADQTGSQINIGSSALILFSAFVNEVCSPVSIGNTAYVDGFGFCSGPGLYTSTVFVATPAVTSLKIDKTQIPAAPAIGSPVTYRMVVTNIGTATVDSLILTDTVSPTLISTTAMEPTGFPAPVITGVASGTRYVWSGGPGLAMAPGVAFTFTIQGTVGVVCSNTYVSNTAFVSAVNACAPASATSMISPATAFTVAANGVSIAIMKRQTPATPQIGNPIMWEIFVSNIGTDTVTSLTLTDTIPAAVVSASALESSGLPTPVISGAGASGTLFAWNAAGPTLLVPGATFSITITGNVGLVCLPTLISNTAYVLANGACSSTLMSGFGPSYLVSPPVTSMSVVKQQVAPVTTPGAPVLYRIVATNIGSATITGITVIDTISRYIVSATASEPSGFPTPTVSSNASGTTFTWSNAAWTVNPGVSFTFTISGFVAPECNPWIVSNTAYVAATAACTTTVYLTNPVQFQIQGAQLAASVVKQQIATAPGVGSPWLWQIVVTNTGADTITSLTVTDTIPAVFVSSTGMEPSGFPTPVVTDLGGTSGTRYAWSNAATSLGPLQSFTFTISGRLGLVCLPTPLSNTAFITAAACSSTALFASAPGAILVPPVTGLTVRKNMIPATPGPGNQVTYQIVVANSGQMTITSLNVVDTVGPVITFSATANGASFAPAGFGAGATIVGGGTTTRFEWTGNALTFQPGQVFTFTITGNVGTVCTQTLVSNTAWIAGRGDCTTTVLTTNETDFTLNAPVLDFTVTKLLTGGVAIGDPITYRIVVYNNGAATIENLRVLDTVSGVIMNQASTVNDKPASFALPTVTSVGTGTQYVWSAANPLGILNPGQSFTFTITGNVGPVCAATTLTNTVFADGGIACSQVNRTGWSANTVIAPAVTSLSIVKTLSKTPAAIGDPVEYRIVVTNNGTATLTSAAIVDTLPSVFVVTGTQQPVAFNPPVAFSPAVGSTRFTWSNAANLLPNTAYTVTITGTAGYVCATIGVSNTAFAAGTSICSSTAVTSSVVGYVYGTPSLGISVTKQLTGGTGVGAPLGYLIYVTNTGGATLTDLIVVDTVSPVLMNGAGTVPANFALAVTSQAGSGTRYVWSNTAALTFNPGQIMTFTITGQAGLVCAATTVTNTVYVNGSFFCGATQDLKASANAVIQPPVTGLTVSKLMPQFALSAGDPVRYQIVVVNSGTATLNSLIVNDTVNNTIVTQTSDRNAAFFNAPTIVNLGGAPGGTWYQWTNSAPITPGSIFTFTITGFAGEVCASTLVSNTAWIQGSSDCSTTTMRTNGVSYTYGVPALGLSVVKTVGGSAGVGAPISYRVYVQNTGGATLTSLVITDTLSPVVMNAVVDLPTGFTQAVTSVAGSGTRYDWTNGGGFQFFPTQVLTFTITGQIGMVCATTTISNSAYANGAFSCGGIPAIGSAGTVVVVPPVLNLTVRKNQAPAAPGVGAAVTYQVIVTNVGAATANAIDVVDTVSNVIMISSVDAPAAFGAPIVTPLITSTRFEWTAANPAGLLNPGSSFTFTITGNVGLVCAQADVSNTGWISGSGTCTTTVLTTNNVFFQVPAPVLSIAVSKKLTGGAGVGAPVSYLIVVENIGGATITNLTVTDTVPSQVVNVTTDAGGLGAPVVTSVASGTRYAWSGVLGAPLNPASVFTVTITGNIGVVCANTQVSNTAFVTAFNSCATDIKQTNAVGALIAPHTAGLTVVKALAPASPGVGTAVTYTITVQNTGTATLTGITVSDTLSPVITAPSGNTPAGFSAPVVVGGASTTQFAWTSIAPFLPGTSQAFTINGTVGLVCVSTDVANTAYVSATREDCNTGLTAKGSSAMFNLPAPVLGFTVVKTLTGGKGVGSPVTYDILVTNTGGATITDLIVTDTVANQIVNVTPTQPGGWAAPLATSVATGTRYVWSNTGLLFYPGTALTFSLGGNVGVVCANTQVSNTALVEAKNECANLYVQGAAVGALIAPHTAGLTVVKSLSPVAPGVGSAVTYTITVQNTGTATLTGITVSDTLSPVITGVTQNNPAPFTANAVVQTGSGTEFSWSAATMLPGTSVNLTLDGVVGLVCVSTDVANTAYVSATREDCNTGLTAKGSSAMFNLPAPVLGFTVVKTLTGGKGVGSPVTYTIDVTNTGGATITDLTVVDTVANQIVNVTSTEPLGWAPATAASVASGTRYIWSNTGLLFYPGTALQFTLAGNVGVVCANTQISNTALVEAKNACANLFVQGAAVGALVAPHLDAITVVKTQTGGAGIGAPVTYTIDVTNTGTSTITQLVVVDTVGRQAVNLAPSQPGGWAAPIVSGVGTNATRYVWSNNALTFQPGQSLQFTLLGNIGVVCANTQVSNTVMATATVPCGLVTDVAPPVGALIAPAVNGLTVVKSVSGGGGVGAPVTYTIDVTNTGTSTLTGVIVTDTISAVITAPAGNIPAGFAAPVVTGGASATRFDWAATGPFLPGTSRSFTIDGIIGLVCVATDVSNTAYARGTADCAVLEASGSSAVLSFSAPVLGMSVVKTLIGGAGVGSPVTYTIDVTNTGGATIETLTVTDTVANQIVNVAPTVPGGFAQTVTSVASGTRYEWTATGLTFNPGTSLQFRLDGNVGVVCANTTISNTALVEGRTSCAGTYVQSNAVGALVAPHVNGITVVKTQTLPTGNAGVGEPVLYTIDVTNTGTSTITQLIVVDSVSESVMNIAPTQPGGWVAPVIAAAGSGATRYVWSNNALSFQPGQTLTFTLAGDFGLVCAATQVSNTAMATATVPCGLVSDVSTPVGSLIAPHIESLSIVKSVVGGAGVAAPVTYTITVQNTGTSTLANVLVTDTVSPYIVIGSQTTAGGFATLPVVQTPSGTLYGWSIASFLPGASAVFTLDGVVGQVCVATDVGNTAFISAETNCAGTITASESAAVLSFSAPALTVQVIKSQAFPTGAPGVGEPVTYTLDVTNTGAATITSLTLLDTVATELFVTSTTQPGGWAAPTQVSVAGTGTRYEWTNNALTFSPGATLQFVINANIGLVCGPTTVDNTALVLAANLCAQTNDLDGPVTFAVAPPTTSYTVTKIQTPAAPAGTGSAVTYAIVVTNTGSATLSSAIVTDTIEPLITGVTTSRPAGFPAETVTSVASGTRYVWSGTTATGLLPGESWTFTMTGLVGIVCNPVSVSNTAYVNARSACSVPGGQFTNVTGFDLTAPAVGVSIVKTQTPAAGSVLTTGAPVSYQIDITNTGAATISDVTLTDTLSPVLTQIAPVIPGGFAAPVIVSTASGTRYVWTGTGLTFSPGATLSFTINAVVGEVCSLTTVSNTAVVEAGTLCGSARAQSGVQDFSVGPFNVGLTLVKTQLTPAQDAAIGAGVAVQYQLVVTNTGSATLNSVTIVDTLAHTIRVASTTQPGLPAPVVTGVAGSASRFVWSGTGLSFLPGQSFTINIIATAGDVTTQTHVSNTAYVDGRNACNASATMISGPVDFFISTSPTIITVSKVQFSVTTAGNPVIPSGTVLPLGYRLGYRIVVNNIGGTTVTDLLVDDTIPNELTNAVRTFPAAVGYVETVTSVASGTRYEWHSTTAALNIGEKMTVTVTGQVGFVCAAVAPINEAYAMGVSQSGSDDDLSVNNGPAVNFVTNPLATPVLTVQKTAAFANLLDGDGQSYRIVVSNTGFDSVYNFSITDLLPSAIVAAGLTTQYATNPIALTETAGTPGLTPYSWTAPVLPPRTTLTITITGTTDPCFPGGVVSNQADAAGNSTCLTPVAASGVATFTLNPNVNYTLVKTQQVTGGIGAPIMYRIDVKNTGLMTITDMLVVDTVSSIVTNVATSQPSGAGFGAPVVTSVATGTRYEWSVAGSLAPLAPGDTWTFTVTGNVGVVCVATSFNNTAVSSGGTGCISIQRASATAGVTVAPHSANLSIAQSFLPAAPSSGGQVVFNIVATNTGSDTLSNVTLGDLLPPPGQFTVDPSLYAQHGIAVSGGLLAAGPVWNGTATQYTWTQATMLPGETIWLTITGTAADCYNGTVVNLVSATATGDSCATAVIRGAPIGSGAFTISAPGPVLTSTKDWYSDPTWSLKSPVPQMGSKVYWKILVANTGGKPSYNPVTGVAVEIVDTLPSAWANLDTSRYPTGFNVIVPAGMTAVTTTSLSASGDVILAVAVSATWGFEPNASVTLYVDGEVRQWSAGTAVVDNHVFATGLNPCNGLTVSSAAGSASFVVAPRVTLNIKIYNAAGEVVRTYPVYQVGKKPDALDLSYTVTGSVNPTCALVAQDDPAQAPFSPDGDCHNDLVAFIFPELGGFGVSWDGRNDQGQYVANGSYQVVAEFVDPQDGNPYVLDAFITLSAKRAEVLATIYNAAGETVALIDTSRVPRAVATVTLEPSPYAPVVNPAGPQDALRIHLFDAQGIEIDADGDMANGITPLLWYGRTCPTDPDRICDTPTAGQIVNNGAYLIQLISSDINGDVTTVTAGITVSHGELELITNVVPAPNPVPSGADETWITYHVPGAALANLSVKIYNVAGELVRQIQTSDMMGPGEDPFGTSAGVNCPTGNCGVFKWDLKNQSGQRAANGLYVIVIDATDAGGTIQRTLTKLAIQ